MSIYCFYFVFIYFIIFQNRINCNEGYKYINISSFEEFILNLQNRNYIILRFYNTKLGDIVCQFTQPLKNATILIYNDLKKIKQNEFGNFINYESYYNEGESIIINKNDAQLNKKNHYFLVFHSNQTELYNKIIIFNEHDIKQMSIKENFLIKQVFSNKKFQISYSLSNLDIHILVFDFQQHINEGISITIQNENLEKIIEFNKIEKDFIYKCCNSKETNNTLYYIIIETEESYSKINLNFLIEIEKEELFSGQNSIKTLINNYSFLYYVNLLNYNLNEEYTIEIEFKKEILSKDFEINNQLLNDYNTTIQPTERIFNYSIREIKGLEYYYFLIPFKKLNKDNKLFLLNIKYNGDKRPIADLYLSKKMLEYNITEKDISDSSIYELKVPINQTYRNYIKLRFINGFPNNKNVLIYISEKNSLILYQGNLLLNGTNNINENYNYQQLFIITKDNINKITFENTITIGLKGNSVSVLIQIKTDSNKIIFNNDFRSYNKTFLFDLINCKEPLYFVESYDNDNIDFNYSIFESLYGNYNISYLSPIENINFITSEKKLLDQNIFLNNLSSIIYSIQCQTPTSLRLRFIKEINEGKEILEREEIIGILKNNTVNYSITNKSKSVLILEANNDIILKYAKVNKKINKSEPFFLETSDIEKFSIEKDNNKDCLIKLFLSSYSLYTKIIDGNSEIEYSKNNILFKFRKDIFYDYVSFEIISKRNVKKINLFYDLIKMGNYNGRFYLPNPTKYYSFENNYTMNITNPYHQNNSKIKSSEYVFLIFNFTNKKEDYNIYINIRYLNYKKLKNIYSDNNYTFVEINNVYRICTDNEEEKNNNFVINVNKCNNFLKYNLIHYIFDENNIIEEQKIEKNGIYKFKEKIYNNTKLELKSLESTQNNSNDKILLNYFFISEKDFNKYSYKNEFKIELKDDGRLVTITWSQYLFNDKDEAISTKYKLFILYQNSSINGICDLIKENENYTFTNETSYKLFLSEGDYKINIIAYSLDTKFPVFSIYNELIINIPQRSSSIFVVIGFIIIIVFGSSLVFIFIYYGRNKKKKKGNYKVSGIIINNSSKEELISVDD